ncbi:hypothetical protein JNUCC0626_47760 [Lentzea sp. JNUCC 0626]|uniref:hypothetical protein n=1 Tax=Lentzea sp. JNUCC 0626 TaxID=3367513 RepID=UPI003749AB8D
MSVALRENSLAKARRGKAAIPDMAGLKSRVAMVVLGMAALGGVVMPGVAHAEGKWVRLEICTRHYKKAYVRIEGYDPNGVWEYSGTAILDPKGCSVMPGRWLIDQTVLIPYFNAGDNSAWTNTTCYIQKNVASGSTRRCFTPAGPS